LPYIKKNGEEFKEYPTTKMTYNTQYDYFKFCGDEYEELTIFEYESEERYDYLLRKQYLTYDGSGRYDTLFLFKTLMEMDYCRKFIFARAQKHVENSKGVFKFIDETDSDFNLYCYIIKNRVASNNYNNYVTLINICEEIHVLKHNFSSSEFENEIGNHICKFGNIINNYITVVDEERFIITDDLKIAPIGSCEEYEYIYDPPVNKLVLE
jgi:hypothetical protein